MTTKSMTVAEAGRLGGEKVKATRGREFFVEIGKKGGRAAKATGLDYVALGRLGAAGRIAALAAANSEDEDAIDAIIAAAGVSR